MTSPLARREEELLRLVRQGHDKAVIAGLLAMAPKQVDEALVSLAEKLQRHVAADPPR